MYIVGSGKYTYCGAVLFKNRELMLSERLWKVKILDEVTGRCIDDTDSSVAPIE